MSAVEPKESEIERLKAVHGLGQFVGRSPQLGRHLMRLTRVAGGDATVLLVGETGTGKELTARALHYLSPRSGRAFVPVNCGALPSELVENELFGHVAGAYTGAGPSSDGLVSEAEGGTLFLDEVDSLPHPAQAKLLRFLQEKEIRAVGSRKSRRIDARVVAAANTDLRRALQSGEFRMDLYYRLNVVSLRLPPLRERRDDILELAAHFIRQYALRAGVPERPITPSGRQKLLAHPWPGNVRELDNVIERAMLLADGDRLDAPDLVLDDGEEGPGPAGDFKTLKSRAVAAFERSYIQDLLRAHDGNIGKAARQAGKHRRAFWELMRKHGLTQPRITPHPPVR